MDNKTWLMTNWKKLPTGDLQSLIEHTKAMAAQPLVGSLWNRAIQLYWKYFASVRLELMHDELRRRAR